MKLYRLYSNRNDVFQAVQFNRGLSAVMAEIRVPANRQLDTHNLGKTTIGELLDFCLLRGKSQNFFLYKHGERFAGYTFYLEIQLPDGRFLTLARPVTPGSRVSFAMSEAPLRDVTTLDGSLEWDHVGVAFDRARLLLDGYLSLDVLQPWHFRKLVGYLIRSQRDYQDVFQLGKFSGKHQDWKPFVGHLLGLSPQPVMDLYAKREELADGSAALATLTREWGGDDVDASVVDGLIAVKRREIETRAASLDSFDFGEVDLRLTAEVVEGAEQSISALNDESYRLAQLMQRISESIAGEQIVFRPRDAERLFNEAGVVFGEQIKREYDQLVAFNQAITNERREALEQQLVRAQERSAEIRSELDRLNDDRAQSLEFLRESDTLAKYKELSRELATLQGELSALEARRSAASRLLELRRNARALQEEFGHLETQVESEIEELSADEESRFGRLRRYFTEIVYEVLGQNALIAIRANSQGGLEFTAEFIGDAGTATSGDRGTSYRKLLCIAFDLAMLRAYSDVNFPRFVYHDGALEQLEPRKREKLIGVLREYDRLGFQPVISLLDSDLPAPLGSSPSTLSAGDVVLTLHDEGASGRLFRDESW